ncbi:MAG: DUF2877 domain-containing protein [Microbacteriaceae bacterium]
MTPPPVIASPGRVRVDAAKPAPWRSDGPASIVHLGQSALVLRTPSGQLIITSGVFGLVPGGIEVAPAELSRLRHELGVGGTIGDWRPAIVEPVDLSMRPVSVDAAALELLDGALRTCRPIGSFDPSRQGAQAAALTQAAVSGVPVMGTLLRLIGAGPGSTPAGDDVVAGVLAGLRATGNAAAATALGMQVLPMLTRTTSASAHYLAAAADGRFADRVHQLVAGLADVRAAARAVGAASTFGASSGTDLLAGIVAAARSAHLTRKSA